VGLVAEHYMTGAALAKACGLLGGGTIDSVGSWADDYRHDHPETGPWHYIDIPLADSKMDLARECANGDCVIAKTEEFLAVLKGPGADSAKRAEALKFVIHFIGDMHQPLHDEDDGDKGGNARHVIFDGRPDNLHWIWDTGYSNTSTGIPRLWRRSWRATSRQRIGPSGSRATSRTGFWRDTGSLRRSLTETWAARTYP
jgi:hypothetical protein